MNFDEMQELWKSQPAAAPPDEGGWTEAFAELRESARKFDRMIFWRDLRECLAAAVLAVWFGIEAWEKSATGRNPWLCWAAAALPLGVMVYLLWDRRRHRHLRPLAGAQMVEEIQRSIARLRHQVRLLRGILWWYCLPLAASGLLIGADTILAPEMAWSPLAGVAGVLLLAGILIAINVWIYRLNRRAVRDRLVPEIGKLEAALQDLTDPLP